ncbi:uncharacterized protein LOC123004413 [Tribolium madens]|uniref:uncharacterized protein LOC123004413 n=1 Tax=Tribolium madens TaxID=41895 RepID=UPI001CF7372E|nr:uncharacterized protein LOC123004413 [Tribolium madens]XP_044253604.1 uncharacterized protein LOC123004413 [Tribolium madens]XP_044253605.1 uncharacterized protein LOC123004413 [Tribolium madens]
MNLQLFRPILFVLFLTQTTINGNFLTSNVKADLEGGYLCPDNNQLEVPMRLFRIDRFNRTHRAISIDFTFAHPLDETAEGAIFVEKYTEGDWKMLPSLSWQKDPCNNIGMRYGRENMIRTGKALGWKNPDKCPIPAGNYSMIRHPFITYHDTPFWPGRFRVQMVLRRIATKRKIFCTMTIMNFAETVN